MGRIPSRPGLDVFANKTGMISIEQIDSGDPDRTIVVVHPGDVDLLIRHLQDARERALEIDPDAPEPDEHEHS